MAPIAGRPATLFGAGYRTQRAVGGYPRLRTECDSLAGFRAFADRVHAECLAVWPDCAQYLASWDASHPPADHWDLGLGFDGAQALLAAGRWDKGLELMRAERARVAIAERFDGEAARTLSVVGSTPCVAAALAGSPSHMWRMTEAARQTAQKPIVRIGLPLGMPASVNAENAAQIAVAVLRVLEAVERSGARVQLVAYENNSSYGDIRVTLKSPEAPLSLAAVSAMVHPATSRRPKFCMHEAHALMVTQSPRALDAICDLFNYGHGLEVPAGEFDAAMSYLDWLQSPATVQYKLTAQIEGNAQ